MDETAASTREIPADSSNAFADLMRDHADMVYSAARRQLGDCAMAEDVMQAVFILLWKKAGSIKGPVAGWLVRTTYFTCCDARKLAARRQYHERMAATMKPEDLQAATEPGWESYAKVLDEAMARLREKDRDAVALRYFRGLSFKQVGLAIGTGEDAAKKRVERAIARLRQAMLMKVPVPAGGVLATQLEARCIEAAPHGLIANMMASARSGVKGTVADAVVRKAELKRVWISTAIVAITVITVGVGSWLMYLAVQAEPGDSVGAGTNVTARTNDLLAGDQALPIVLNIKANIDGSDVLNITSAGAEWIHTAWQEPRQVTINGANFNIHAKETLDQIGLGAADLSLAQVIQRSGRGTIAMEKTGNGIAIHFADPAAAAAPYAIKVGFATKSAMPATLPTTVPSANSILFDLKATIAGSDVLTITHEGAKWRHVNADWPSDVAMNDQAWDVRAQPTLDNTGLAGADLSSAEVIEHSGRDTVVMEKTGDGIVIYFGDAVGGAGQYEIKIRFSRLK
jgi:RNA polymerase sigma factor (sigma-70 family)